ncbi:MAG TPA: nucleoside deaminase [Leptospiraceae bacterium]|nr:nucleoside deaminase [Leptospiraceae bacterium]HMW05838.1 nucleoside deaminase [Leptospiraceae bacterium]HMX33572.1 nucleoside deaminase [Leptospiraceae bacterium]HMY34370.1 nucleoside deaminase [Leptospiraceae bacterium]HMZ64126.1 nucleoside deaminase [Leptospiraceae bacterium]
MIQTFLEKFISITRNHPEEIPSFSQIYLEGSLVSEAFNQVEENKTTYKHSEILCIESAQKKLQTKFLNQSILLTTIEPCIMCAGAIIHARIEEVIYFLEATKTAGITSLSFESIYSKNHFPKLTFLYSEDVEKIVQVFFKDKRN